jgi:hypothetical protein
VDDIGRWEGDEKLDGDIARRQKMRLLFRWRQSFARVRLSLVYLAGT